MLPAMKTARFVASALRILINSRILNVTGISNLHDDMKTEGFPDPSVCSEAATSFSGGGSVAGASSQVAGERSD